MCVFAFPFDDMCVYGAPTDMQVGQPDKQPRHRLFRLDERCHLASGYLGDEERA